MADKDALAEKMRNLAMAAQMSVTGQAGGTAGGGKGLASITGDMSSAQEAQLVAPYQERPKAKGDIKSAAVAAVVRKSDTGIRVVGRGSGSVDEMAKKTREDTVQWGLLRFAFGSGTFKRVKLLLIHFNGEKCAGIRRARINSGASKVLAVLGETNAKLTLTETSELTVDNILEQTKHVFVADAAVDFSIADMKADYEAMIEESRKKLQAKLAKEMESSTVERQTAKELGISAEEALAAVRKPMGPFNWALFHPDPSKLEIFDAGSLSVAEMRKSLAKDQVLGGLLRMGFGAGQWRRTKWISIWWAGDGVGSVKRGQISSKKGDVLKGLMPWNVTVEANDLDEITLEVIIDKVKRSAVIDGDDVDGIGGARDTGGDPFSMEAYYAALKEEMDANAGYFGEAPSGGAAFSSEVRDTIKAIRDADGEFTWGLFELDE